MQLPTKQEALYRTMHNAFPAYRNINQGISRLRHWITSLKEPPASILDVGCGNGKLCKLLSEMGYDVTGLDIVPGPYDRGGYNFIRHDITRSRLPFTDKAFDYCLSFDVLEHLPTKWSQEHVWDMLRVANGLIGTVACYSRSILHLTVKEPEWWMEIMSHISKEEVEYRVFNGGCGETLLFLKKENLK